MYRSLQICEYIQYVLASMWYMSPSSESLCSFIACDFCSDHDVKSCNDRNLFSCYLFFLVNDGGVIYKYNDEWRIVSDCYTWVMCKNHDEWCRTSECYTIAMCKNHDEWCKVSKCYIYNSDVPDFNESCLVPERSIVMFHYHDELQYALFHNVIQFWCLGVMMTDV
jgi:hypothetical protein